MRATITTPHFSIDLFENNKGYFEHIHHGDNCGGELWFEVIDNEKTLVDYDGVACLPREVWQALETVGIKVEEDFK